jgi:alkanesulfonate monooxygenase SsuD/methylene tetrahydromethanopterin reductase-like flavin-dependent oxidoreductase (luciferase family)
MVTDEERDYMYADVRRRPAARINLGIRRRLAPLLDNDRGAHRADERLLLSMPGTPGLYYGDEIGMGDNIYLGDRDGVRTPMQWSSDRNGGFSTGSRSSTSWATTSSEGGPGMAVWVLMFDMRAPDFGAPRGELYRAALDMAAWADERGCAAIVVPEHHFSEDHYLPSPLVMAGALAARTTRCVITVRALVLPLHDPVRAAEDTLVVDNLSGGRLMVALVPGYAPAEFAGFDVELDDRFRLLEEKTERYVAALSGEPLDEHGTVVTPRPLGRRPAVLIGGASAAAARRAARLADGFSPAVADPELVRIYEEECARLGRPASPTPVAEGPMSVFVSTDPERDRARLAPHVRHEIESYAAIGAVNEAYRELDVEAAMAPDGQFPVLTPEECRALVDALGPIEPVVMKPLLAGCDPALGWSSLELFATEVLPRLHG